MRRRASWPSKQRVHVRSRRKTHLRESIGTRRFPRAAASSRMPCKLTVVPSELGAGLPREEVEGALPTSPQGRELRLPLLHARGERRPGLRCQEAEGPAGAAVAPDQTLRVRHARPGRPSLPAPPSGPCQHSFALARPQQGFVVPRKLGQRLAVSFRAILSGVEPENRVEMDIASSRTKG